MKTISNVLEVTKENLDSILDLFDKKKDSEGFIIEKSSGKVVICPYSGKKVHSGSFSILPGSATFVNNFPYCFAEHMSSHFDRRD